VIDQSESLGSVNFVEFLLRVKVDKLRVERELQSSLGMSGKSSLTKSVRLSSNLSISKSRLINIELDRSQLWSYSRLRKRMQFERFLLSPLNFEL
jgi:hypothetical protein